MIISAIEDNVTMHQAFSSHMDSHFPFNKTSEYQFFRRSRGKKTVFRSVYLGDQVNATDYELLQKYGCIPRCKL